MTLQVEDVPSLSYDELVNHIRLSKVNREYYQSTRAVLEEELLKRSPLTNYKCFKCGHGKYEIREVRVSQGFWSGFFELQSGRYQAVVCSRCKFTEFYHGNTSDLQQAADLLLGS